MAEALARHQPGDSSPVGKMTAADWFSSLESYVEADARVKSATNARKDLRKKIEELLGDPELMWSFDQARKNRDLSGELRAKRDAAYAKLMEFERKPVGYQGGLALPLTVADAARVDLEGLEAGKSKATRGENPYVPGSEEFERWDTAWRRGQAQIASSLTTDPDKKRAALGVVDGGRSTEPPAANAPKRRGRPPGSKNRVAAGEGGEQRTPDAGEGGDTGEGTAGDPPPPEGGEGEGAPAGDPPSEEGEQTADRYGQAWPAGGSSGTTH